ncbi:MAG: ATP-binding protein [Candidatus Dojkabacteria bacterium]|nr:ATP-binding protein [Candidatus Dojkabacteria bacterium]
MLAIITAQNYSFNFYSYPFLLVGLVILSLGIIVFVNKSKKMVHLSFFAVTLSLFLWMVSNGFSFMSLNESVALFWQKMCWIGVITLVPNLYIFTHSLIDDAGKVKKAILVYLTFIPFLILLPSSLIVSRVKKYYWGYDAVGGDLITAFVVYVLIVLFLIFYSSIRALSSDKLNQTQKSQVRIHVISTFIASLSALDFLPSFGQDYYPLGFIAVGLWAAVISIAINRYQLFTLDPMLATPSVFNTMIDLLFITDFEGRITYVNHVTCKTLGKSMGELKDGEIKDFIPDIGTILGKNKDLMAKGFKAPVLIDTTVVLDKDKKITVELSANVIRNQSGIKVGYVFICHDVSKEKEASESRTAMLKNLQESEKELGAKVEELESVKKAMLNVLEDLNDEKVKLEKSKARDEAVLLAIGEGLVVTDRAGRVLLVNRTFEEMLNITSNEAIGKSLNRLVPMVDEQGKVVPAKKRLRVLLMMPGKRVVPMRTTYFSTTDTYYFVRRDKSKFPVSITTTPILIKGKVLGVVEVFRDVTKEREVDRAKSEFVSLASHQLRTPLSTISWYAEMLLSEDVGKVSTGQRKYIDQIYKANRRLIELVDALLNVSRLEMGTFMVEPTTCDIVEITRDVIDELKPLALGKEVKIKENFEKNLPPVKADPKLLRIIIQNLLTNSVKYNKNKGNVLIEILTDGSNRNEIGKHEDYVIKVSDTGYGIPKEQQSQIFTKMFRADNVKSLDTEGTGLGLYMVKSIVEHTGGKIWFESEIYKGTTFFVSLPQSGMKKKKEGTKELI